MNETPPQDYKTELAYYEEMLYKIDDDITRRIFEIFLESQKQLGTDFAEIWDKIKMNYTRNET